MSDPSVYYDKDRECAYKIESRTMASKGIDIKKMLYIQVKSDRFDKTALSKLDEWTKKAKEDGRFDFAKASAFKEGISFDQGNIENTVSQRLLISTEKALRQKFEKEQQELEEQMLNKKQELEQQRVFRVKVPNVMFFEDDLEKQKEKLTKKIFDVVELMKKELNFVELKFNKRSFFRFDKVSNNILDYLLFIFDSEKIAQTFCDLAEGIEFNKCILRPEILPPRDN